MSYFDPLQYGAKADGKTLDSKAIQAAIDAAEANGGGTVVFKSGKVYYSGSLVLKSNVFLHVEQGSLLQCSHVSYTRTCESPGSADLVGLCRHHRAVAWRCSATHTSWTDLLGLLSYHEGGDQECRYHRLRGD